MGWPNPLTHTVTIGHQASNNRQADSLLVSRKTSLRADSYTFSLLKLLSNSGNYPELQSIMKLEITSHFQMQWDAFMAGEYPFVPSSTSHVTLFKYWMDLRKDPKAFLVAVNLKNKHLFSSRPQIPATVMFAISPNSIAEERTMSGITYMNSTLRALQSVSTVTNQVKVCQWYIHIALHDGI